MLTLELLRGIKEISNNNNTPESWSKEQIKLIQEYKQQGAKFGNNVEGYRKVVINPKEEYKVNINQSNYNIRRRYHYENYVRLWEANRTKGINNKISI